MLRRGNGTAPQHDNARALAACLKIKSGEKFRLEVWSSSSHKVQRLKRRRIVTLVSSRKRLTNRLPAVVRLPLQIDGALLPAVIPQKTASGFADASASGQQFSSSLLRQRALP